MPLDWSEVQRRYGMGATIPTVAGGKTLEITSVDDNKIYIRHRLWTDALCREHLERAAELIEEGRITRHAGRSPRITGSRWPTSVRPPRPTCSSTSDSSIKPARNPRPEQRCSTS